MRKDVRKDNQAVPDICFTELKGMIHTKTLLCSSQTLEGDFRPRWQLRKARIA